MYFGLVVHQTKVYPCVSIVGAGGKGVWRLAVGDIYMYEPCVQFLRPSHYKRLRAMFIVRGQAGGTRNK